MLLLLRGAEAQAVAFVGGKRAQADLFDAADELQHAVGEGNTVTLEVEGRPPVTLEGKGRRR